MHSLIFYFINFITLIYQIIHYNVYFYTYSIYLDCYFRYYKEFKG